MAHAMQCGFGAPSFACGGLLFVKTLSGSIQRLPDDGQGWG